LQNETEGGAMIMFLKFLTSPTISPISTIFGMIVIRLPQLQLVKQYGGRANLKEGVINNVGPIAADKGKTFTLE
jgi:alanine dehydrogenase